MEEWKEYKLGEICHIRRGASPRPIQHFLSSQGMPWIKIADATANESKYLDSTKEYIIAEGVPKSVTVLPGTLIVSNSATPGLPKIVRIKACVHDGWLVIDDFDGVLRDFLYYKFIDIRRLLNNQANGSVFMNLKTDIVKDFLIKVPSIKTQQKIASILSSLDDKIEINRRINENLEQQAQALFKSWFVDFEPFKNGEFVESELGMIPKGWRMVTLDEMTSKFGTGLNPRQNFKLGEGKNYYVTIKNMNNNRVYLDDRCDKVTDEAIEKINKRSKLQAGDLLFSGIGTIGRVALITETPKNWNTSESVFNMHPADTVSSEFLYVLLLSDVFQNYVKLHALGGVQQGIRMASLKEYQMVIPDELILRDFDRLIIPLISKIKSNERQSDDLASIRDTLLPKLMSGELI